MRISDMANMGLRLGNRLNVAIKASEKASERLSSGKRINQAADSPSDMLRISRFGAQTRGSKVAQQNIQEGISLTQTMDHGLAAIEELGQQLRELAVSYHSDGISTDGKAAIKTMGDAIQTEIQHRIENTMFGGAKVYGKDKWTLQTGPYSGDNITINIGVFAPVINFFGSVGNGGSPDDSGTPAVPPADGDGNAPPTIPPTTPVDPAPTPIPHFSLVSPEVQIPGQCGFTGYRKVLNNEGQTLYEGHLKNGTPDGYGKLYNDGVIVYEGDWNNGTIDGFGRLYDTQGREKYTGVTKMGTPHGYGTYFENGQLHHQGEFVDGYRQGWGTSYTNHGPVSMYYNDFNLKSGQQVNTNELQEVPDSNGSTPPTGDVDNPSPEMESNDPSWLSLDKMDASFFKPLAQFRSYLGSMQRVLEHRLSFQQRSEEIGRAALSKIQDADVAHEALEFAKQQMLATTSLQLIQQTRVQNREFILRLLS